MNTVESLKEKLRAHLAARPTFTNVGKLPMEEYSVRQKAFETWIADKGEIEMSLLEAENPSIGRGIDWKDERAVGEKIYL